SGGGTANYLRADGTWSTPTGGGGSANPRSVTEVVAASNSANTAGADFVCTGTGDETCIMNAIAALPAGGGTVLLRAGTYNIANSIVIARSYVNLEGEGHPMWGAFLHGWTGTGSPAGSVGNNSTRIVATGTGYDLITFTTANLPDNGES